LRLIKHILIVIYFYYKVDMKPSTKGSTHSASKSLHLQEIFHEFLHLIEKRMKFLLFYYKY